MADFVALFDKLKQASSDGIITVDILNGLVAREIDNYAELIGAPKVSNFT